METLSSWGETDWTYLVVSPQNPFKEAEGAATGKERYLASLEALHRHPSLKVWLDDIELRLPPPSYTIRTLDLLKKREPDNDFTLVVGADNLAVFRSWKDYRRILLEYGIAVYPREGFDIKSLTDSLLQEDPAYRIRILDCPLVNISSTFIREARSRGEDVSQYLM